MKLWNARSEWLPLSIVAAMFAASAWFWSRVPDEMPVHWNVHGEIDRYGSRMEGLLTVPLAALGLYALFLVLPRFDPGRDNYPHFRGAYLTIRVAVLLLMACVHASLIVSAQGAHVPMRNGMIALIAGLFVVIGLVLGKVRPNWFVGIRTPWTLSSKRSWTRSHRLGGWLFTSLGGITLLLSLFDKAAALYFLLAGGFATAIAVVVYSYIVWRHDPERVPPAGTSPSEE